MRNRETGYPELDNYDPPTRPFEGWPAYWLQRPASRSHEELRLACHWGDREIQVLRERVACLHHRVLLAFLVGWGLGFLLTYAIL